jgi:hypothetical protein
MDRFYLLKDFYLIPEGETLVFPLVVTTSTKSPIENL